MSLRNSLARNLPFFRSKNLPMLNAIRVLYEDDSVVVFDKPSGLLSVPTPKNERNTLVNRVNEQCAASGADPLYLCHRLDRDTSGAIIFAKGKGNLDAMTEAFRQREVAKRYVAFVRGRPRPDVGEIRLPIKDFHEQQSNRGRQAPAKSALTRYKVVDARKKFSVVDVEPVTGRTNQIRIHFAKIGHPLLGERLYAFGKDFPVKFPRLALHACEITWRHPVLKKQITVTSELAEDMADFWGRY